MVASPTSLISDKWMPYCFIMYLSDILIVGLVTLVHRTQPNHLKSELEKVRYSNILGIQMVSSIQIPTVMKISSKNVPFLSLEINS